MNVDNPYKGNEPHMKETTPQERKQPTKASFDPIQMLFCESQSQRE